MSKQISWTTKLPDRVKREVRVTVDVHQSRWQFKRSDKEDWDYDSSPTSEDWDMLEDILTRRSQRGRQEKVLEHVRKMRQKESM